MLVTKFFFCSAPWRHYRASRKKICQAILSPGSRHHHQARQERASHPHRTFFPSASRPSLNPGFFYFSCVANQKKYKFFWKKYKKKFLTKFFKNLSKGNKFSLGVNKFLQRTDNCRT